MHSIAIPPINSSRLRLVSMSLPLLHLLCENNLKGAQAIADFTIPANCPMPERMWMARRLLLIEADRAQHKWMYRAIVRKADNSMVGHISFHHQPPDPDLLGFSEQAVEMGYTISPEWRRQGIARESTIAMMNWAHREAGVRTFILTISPDNAPSIRLAESMHFQRIGEHFDAIDGLEYIMKADIEEIPLL